MDSWGGLRPPRPPHMVVCTPATPFLDFGLYFFVILGSMFRNFRHFCRPQKKYVENTYVFGVIREGSGRFREASGGILGGGFAPPPTPPHGGMYTYHAIFGFWALFFRHFGVDVS